MTKAVIVTTDSKIASLVELATSFDEKIAVVVGADSIKGVDSAIRVEVPADVPVEALAPAVAGAVADIKPDVVLVANRLAERVLAGVIAVKLNAAIFTNPVEVSPGLLKVSRYGGISLETYDLNSPVVLVAEGGAEVEGAEVSAQPVASTPQEVRVESAELTDKVSSNLGTARVIVSVGRGLKAQEDLAMIEELAKVTGGTLACSRPIAEGNSWLSRDQYVGISGQHVEPEIYFAIGISGQIQHTAGMDASGLIVAINNDKDASIFEISDYGIVGDLYEVVPALTEALR
ncbi:electron transfer flavoprotein subunit alpha/FixB family protein [Mobiluncus mulieris]|uniref:Electron transfer flavoprotein subunit alpha/FixB family protein n=1 Tax=Mobiluncus mulieris TaxID=2052 RepID=A0A7Y0Y475_9ACTO|nr:electron transfer flavoprotein subunit alpha/FixB family protein [Mobiluncus mulieris]NMW65030.1 electron transfer flavoprotein subunit alpha/FixB family protein [Mobiluncus mulieris]